MKKKLIISIICIAILIITSATVFYMVKIYPYKGLEMYFELRETDVNKLTAHPFDTFILRYGVRDEELAMHMSSQIIDLEAFSKPYPVELVKPVGKDKICVIYKLEDDNKNQYLAHIIFRIETDSNGKYWHKTNEIYFVGEKLSFDDYQDISIGDSITKILDIDHSILADGEYQYHKGDDYYYFSSYRFLENGVLFIEFKGETKNTEDFVVSSINYYPYDGDEAPAVIVKNSKEVSLFKNYIAVEYLD